MSTIAITIAIAVALFVIAAIVDGAMRRRRFAIELAHGAATPPSLYPRINASACICSGACITACPETDVIAIVAGRPRLVRPAACVGHADCVRSCPMDAIELVLGSRERGVEVPVASATFETTVPGVYVAGEVTGIGLIHNAVAQGRQAARAALATLVSHGSGDVIDLAIVGGGPAGLGAALEARRLGRTARVYDKAAFGGAIRAYPRQKIVMTAPLELPGYGKIKLRRTSKEALVELFADVVARTGIDVVERAEVTAIARASGAGGDDDLFAVTTARGIVRTRRVLLAIGRRGVPRRLVVPGAELPHVVTELADPGAHRGEAIAVVGGGDSAIELAVALARGGARVTLVHRGADVARCKPDNQQALAAARDAGELRVELRAEIRAVERDHVVLATGARVAATRVACCLGADLPSGWLRGLGLELRELRGEPLARSA